jgi:hypothetical protein
MHVLRSLIALALAGGLAACTNGNGAVEPPVTSVNPTSSSYSNLQFNVGTANIGGQIDLNTVVTLRQPNGLSAVAYSVPSITWTGAFVNTQNAGGADLGKPQITGTLPSNPVGNTAAAVGTFGQDAGSWGAFGYGFDPANSGAGANGLVAVPCFPFFPTALPAALNLTTGTPACASSGGGSQFQGGPPAFPQIRGAALAGQVGAFLGFTPFAGLTPVAATGSTSASFTLTVQLPTSPVSTLTPVTAKISNFAGLPRFATPVLTLDGKGGGTIAYALPAGVTEALLIVEDWGPSGAGTAANCNYGFESGLPFVYSVLVKPGAPNPVGLGYTAGGGNNNGDTLGAIPAVGPLPSYDSTMSICTAAANATAAAASGATPPGGDQVQLIAVGFDYPAFEAAYPQSTGNPTPTITSASAAPSFGQADVTISDLGALVTSP